LSLAEWRWFGRIGRNSAGEFMTAKSLGIAIGRAAQDRLSASHHHGDAYIPEQTA
jgi:hypothetical protein